MKILTRRTANIARALSAFGLLAVAPLSAHADTITVPNFSFESPAVADGGGSFTITGWTKSGNAFTENPDGSIFTGASTGDGTPTGGNGAQSAQLNAGGGIGPASSIQSAASLTTVQAGSVYSLSVAIGDNFFEEPGSLRLGFLLNDAFTTGSTTTLLEADAKTYAPEGEFKDFIFNYTATAADDGKTLKIFLSEAAPSNGSAGTVNFDNVRLSVQPVPEPATWAMMALGLGAMGVWRRKRIAG